MSGELGGRECPVVPADTAARALRSRGASSDPIHARVEAVLRHGGALRSRGVFVDVGCGGGSLWGRFRSDMDRYVAVDAVRYADFPEDGDLRLHDLDAGPVPVADETGDVVVAVETIEHVENPWAFVRDLARVTKRGGWVVVTTPNQLSLLSKATLVVKGQFNAFQDSLYPEHRTALVSEDLRRLALAAGLSEPEVTYTQSGRIPGTGWHYPQVLSRALPSALSDNVVLVARRPLQSRGAP